MSLRGGVVTEEVGYQVKSVKGCVMGKSWRMELVGDRVRISVSRDKVANNLF